MSQEPSAPSADPHDRKRSSLGRLVRWPWAQLGAFSLASFVGLVGVEHWLTFLSIPGSKVVNAIGVFSVMTSLTAYAIAVACWGWLKLQGERRKKYRWMTFINIGMLVGGFCVDFSWMTTRAFMFAMAARESAEKRKPHWIVNSTGEFKIRVRGFWQESRNSDNPVGSITVANPPEGLFLRVSRHPKKVIFQQSLGQFANESLATIVEESQASVVDFRTYPATDNRSAVEAVCDGTFQGMPIRYMLMVIDDPQGYFQILAWTRRGSFEEYAEELRFVAQSVRSVDASKRSVGVAPQD